MQLDDYLNKIPNLHSWDNGKTWNTGGFERQHLEQLHAFLPAHQCMRIVETGAGNSTIVFMLSGAKQVISIAPEEDLIGRIFSYCVGQGMNIDAWAPKIGYSQWELPKLIAAAPTSFDFALIDGAHGWPYVFIDFYYLHHLVRAGGFIMLDDIQLHSVAELVRWLKEQPGYSLALDLGKALIFRKDIAALDFPEWNGQPYIMRNSA